MRQSFIQSTIVFVGLALAAAVLMVTGATVGDSYARTALLTVAAALLGAGLTVFLLRVTTPASS
ncbi:MAG TPA: hypothetical protein VFQ32_07380 [Ktedonobacterales bacterium]|nr:hypothetical protein [Ktedonobacterales bacterium]